MVEAAVFHDQRAREALGYEINIFEAANTYKCAVVSNYLNIPQ